MSRLPPSGSSPLPPPGPPHPRGPHLDDEQISAYLDCMAPEQPHLASCTRCQERLAAFTSLGSAVGEVRVPDAEVRHEAIAAAMRRWDEQSRQAASRPGTTEEATVTGIAAGPGERQRRPGPRGPVTGTPAGSKILDRRRRWMRVGTIAAASALLLGLGTGVTALLASRTGPTAASSSAASSAAPSAGQQKASGAAHGAGRRLAPSPASAVARVARPGPYLGAMTTPSGLARTAAARHLPGTNPQQQAYSTASPTNAPSSPGNAALSPTNAAGSPTRGATGTATRPASPTNPSVARLLASAHQSCPAGSIPARVDAATVLARAWATYRGQPVLVLVVREPARAASSARQPAAPGEVLEAISLQEGCHLVASAPLP
ncbi:MAG: hypothetical protein ACYDH5_18975 [Acidimicrobiales bacterium]